MAYSNLNLGKFALHICTLKRKVWLATHSKKLEAMIRNDNWICNTEMWMENWTENIGKWVFFSSNVYLQKLGMTDAVNF